MLVTKSYSNLRLVGRVVTCHSNAQLMVELRVTKNRLRYAPLCRAFHKDSKKAVTSSIPSRSGGLYGLTVMLLVGCAYGMYTLRINGPLLLEGHKPPGKDVHSPSFVLLKEFLPYVTMDFVNLAFRVQSESTQIDPQCGVHRCDTISFPSKHKYENEHQASATRIRYEFPQEGAAINWASFEIYDAHASVDSYRRRKWVF